MESWKILVVDDEPLVLAVHRAYLERMGHEVVACSESREALALYQRHEGRFDLLLTDYRMPYVNGMQLVQMLHLLDADLPVVMITGFSKELSAMELRNHGIVCLSKPVRYDELYVRLQAIQDA